MRYKLASYILGQVLMIVAMFMLIPLCVSIGYGEDTISAFVIAILAMMLVGKLLAIKKPVELSLRTQEAFVIVALSWLLISLFGCLPFFISKYIPNFIDCIFESVSGFTTTGASIVSNIENFPKSLILWRSLTHWLGGLGIFVFIIAIMPKTGSKSIHLFRAESPGPNVGKLVAKLKFTARILYSIYITLTLLEVVLLLFGGMSLFDSFVHSLGTAGTGGFSSKSMSIANYNSSYIDMVIAIFMIIFSINFNIYFLLIIGKVRQVIKSEELRVFLLILMFSTIAIMLNLAINSVYSTLSQTFRYSFFQVSSIMSTTGYFTADYTQWPMFSQMLLLILMFVGACAGSTAGGLKISRLIILIKSSYRELKGIVAPREITILKFEGKELDANIHHSVLRYFIIYIILFITSILLLSISAIGDATNFISIFSAVATCLNNVGPGFGTIGPLSNFSVFNNFSKIILSIDMLLGRLEIYPLILLLNPRIWKRY